LGYKMIYLDNAATTPVREEACEEMLPYLKEQYGNPSSIYRIGREARNAVEEARERTAEALGARSDEIFFTSGGTESNNLALKGVVRNRGGKMHIITSSIEHHAVLDVCMELEKEGHEVTFLPVDRYGLVNPGDVEKAVKHNTSLVTVMAANNEVGTIQPLEKIGAVARENNIIFHTDAVQAAGNIPVDVNKWNVDLLSISSHKFNGPKGAGALYARKGTGITPLWQGGAQEKKLRPGTENVPAIVGMGKALELAAGELPEKIKELTGMRDRLMEGLLSMEEVVLNGHPSRRLPGNVNVSIKYIEGESLLLSLDMEGIAASSGSACTSGSLDPSHVLTALGLEHELAHGSVRFSLGKGNTMEEIEYLLNVIPGIVERLRQMSSVYRQNKR